VIVSIDRSSTTSRWGPWRLALFALFLIVAGVAIVRGILGARGSSVVEPPLVLSLLPASDLELDTNSRFSIALAPDGRRLAFAATRNDVTQLWLRDLTSNDLQPLAGTNDPALPFWSPDGSALGFFSSGKLRVFVFADGVTRDLAEAPSPQGAAWHPNGDIVFAPADNAAFQRRTADGGVAAFTTLDPTTERSHRFPQLSVDGRHIIFFVQASQPTREGIWIAPYDNPAARRRLAKSDANGLLVDDSLVYSSEGALIAQRIDSEQRLAGAPQLLGTSVGRTAQHELFAASGGNVLIFGTASSRMRELRWVDRTGNVVGILGEPMDAREVRIDPSGGSVAVSRVDPQLNTLDIWIYDGDRPLPRRLSLALAADESAVWSRDGRRLAWVTGRQALTVRDANAATPELTVRKFEHPVSVTDWPTADAIVISQSRDDTHSDLAVVPPDSTAGPRAYATSPFNEAYGAVSPDGRWLAYASDESGRFEIYVDSFPAPGRRARVTAGGGIEPRWSSQGAEIFFRREREVHAIHLDFGGGTPQAASSEKLFDAGSDIRSFDVAPDEQRFLLNLAAPDSGPKPMTVIVNVRSRLIESRR
jgi:Tol biopolymer transport system component